MGETISPKCSDNKEVVRIENDLKNITEGILLSARASVENNNSLSMPIGELVTLGAGVASLIPKLRAITQTTSVNNEGLYQLANAGVGDVLKVAKNGNFWGAFITANETSKFAQLQKAELLSASTTIKMPIDPATIMMAVALFSIEQQLGNIAEMAKQILTFLEVEKEAEIEEDVEMLINIIAKYKLNWDNEHFITSNHKLVLDIQRTARKHMNSYQKELKEVLSSKQFITSQTKVYSMLKGMQKKFNYYRLSLYTFSLASLLEIMLSGNFKEEYISNIKDEIKSLSSIYRNLFGRCSVYLENMSDSAIDTNVIKGIGTASKAIGRFIEGIPVIKKGPVDEFLLDSGFQLEKKSFRIEKNTVRELSLISNPGTGVIVKQMEDIVRIYNHTSQIFFDENKIYLIES